MNKSSITPNSNNVHPDHFLALILNRAEIKDAGIGSAYWLPITDSMPQSTSISVEISIPLVLFSPLENRALDRLNPQGIINCHSVERKDPYFCITCSECYLGVGCLQADWRNDPMIQSMLTSLIYEIQYRVTNPLWDGKD